MSAAPRVARALAVALGVGVAFVGCAVTGPGSGSTPASTTPATPSASPAPEGSPSWAACWSAPAPPADRLSWVDRTAASGVAQALTGMMAHAIAVGDVNDDGWVDLFVGSFADRPVEDYAVRGASGPAPDRLLLGSADGFTVDPRFPGEHARTAGAAFADLDDDHDLDLVLSRNPRPIERGSAGSVILRNDAGVFRQAVVLDADRGGRSVGVLDLDADGRLDIVLLEDRWTGGSSAVYRNLGGFRFVDHTVAAGLPAGVHGLGVSTADLDGDGHGDVFVAGSNRIFLNEAGRLVEQDGDTFAWQVHGDEDDPAGVAAGDLDGDGRPELVIGQHFTSTLDFGRLVPVRVYANLGAGDGRRVRFADVTEAAGLPGLPTKAPHVELADVDADGRLDIVTTASNADGSAPLVLHNTTAAVGEIRFEALDATGSPHYWVTGATIDADHDGVLDIVLAEWEPTLPTLVLAASLARGHWLSIDIGPAGADGIGSQVTVYRAGHLGDPAHLLGRREITASTGFGAGAEPLARFGLGEESVVDVEIRPAGGGAGWRLTAVPTDRHLRVGAGCPG